MSGQPAELDPVIHQATRLRIMAALHRNRRLGFTDLRDGLGLTPGNLGSHLERIESAGYIRSGRVLVDFTFEVQYAITQAGSIAFEAYMKTLLSLAEASGVPLGPSAPSGGIRDLHATSQGPTSEPAPASRGGSAHAV